MKDVTEDEKDFLRFPYEGYWDSEEYKNRKSDSMDITDERNEYYKNQYKKFFPDEWSHVHLGVQYFPLIPLRLMVELYDDEDLLQSVVPFFRDPSKDNAPQHSFVECLPFDYMLKEIECFYHVYHSLAFHDTRAYPIQIQELMIEFEGYLRSLESIANEEALDALYDAQKCVGPMFDALATRTVGMGWEATFRENIARMRVCTERIVRAFYKLESRCYARINMPKPVSQKKTT